MKNNIRVLKHSSIRIASGAGVIYVDPYKVKGEPHDADYIFVTHDHFDHFSMEDIRKICGNNTVLVAPENMKETAETAKEAVSSVVTVGTREKSSVGGIEFETVPSYNIGKEFHPKAAGWVGYIFDLDGERIYVAGDTDINEDILQVKCDAALVPVGGKFTMNAEEAAELVNRICPGTAIPTHYGCIIGSAEDAKVFAEKVKEPVRVDILMEGFGED